MALIGRASKLSGARHIFLRAALCCARVGVAGSWIAVASAGCAQQSGLAGSGRADNPTADALLPDAPEAQTSSAQQAADMAAVGSIHGVVVNGDGSVYEGAQVVLTQAAPKTVRTLTSDSNGRFEFAGAQPGAFTLTVSLNGFTTQTVTGTLHAGESYNAGSIVLVLNGTISDVQVTATQAEIVQEELKEEESQRVLGVFPNFYVTYVPNAPPLTRRQKYSLAWKSSIDPVTFLAVGVFAGIEQAANSYSGYGQGAQGYAKRYGAGYADSFIGSMIGGAILPAWWKQDPRYFYQGTGTKGSRARHAIADAVMCKGDNGHWQVNYSGIVGGLASSGVSNLYYPASSRNGARLTFENALIGTGASAVQNLLQEFVIRKLTPKVPNYAAGNP